MCPLTLNDVSYFKEILAHYGVCGIIIVKKMRITEDLSAGNSLVKPEVNFYGKVEEVELGRGVKTSTSTSGAAAGGEQA